MRGLFYGSVFLAIVWGVSSLEHIHHDNQAVQTFLTDVSNQYPDITKLYSIGKSVGGVDLWVLAIGKDIDSYVEVRPHVKYIGNMHGNEVVSRELLLHLIDHFVSQYSINTTIQSFLDSTVVHIMPTMNPDGYSLSVEGMCTGRVGRNNKDDLDLNRNFPDPWHDRQQKPLAVETQHVIDWLSNYNFVLSASFHGGTVLAVYPYDQYRHPNQTHGPSLCPDDDIFRHLALVYARSHPTMALLNGTECWKDFFFLDGITNGADWYNVSGGMQDYNYLLYGILELTMEVSCCKHPKASGLSPFWDANREPLVNLLLEVHRGVKGIITDENNNTVIGARLHIQGRESVPFTSRQYGEYYRVLLPGQYTLQVSAANYQSASREFTVTEGVTRLDIQLLPSPNPKDGALTFHQGILLSVLKGALLSLLVLYL